MNAKVVKSTSRGQITIPKKWRSQFKTDNYILEVKTEEIIIKPININQIENETVIFDADRDNSGKGISPDEMIKLLKKIKNGTSRHTKIYKMYKKSAFG